MLPPDNHVHSQWSYDTFGKTSMTAACQRAVELGLPAIAFTEHLDVAAAAPGDALPAGVQAGWWNAIRPLDVPGYLAAIAECRERFPSLRVLSGAEVGEPHLFGASAAAVLGSHHFDRVLGSLHALVRDGALVNAGHLITTQPPGELMRGYLAEMLTMVTGSGLFEVAAHLDYPRRHWPAAAGPYDERQFEEEYRAVLRALARSGRVLEINTYSPLASAGLLRWWREEGGRAVSFGSDAHAPGRVGDKFAEAMVIADAAGFSKGAGPFDFWRC